MKNWKHYLSECVLLFVAVVLGLLTDSWRETLADRRQEKQYIESLVTDLKSDVKILNILNHDFTVRIAELDTLISQLDSGEAVIKSSHAHIKAFTVAFLFSPKGFQPSNATLKLLENDGFKIIRNREIIDDVVHYYYEDVDRINTHYQIMMDENMEVIHTMQEVFDFQLLDEFWDPTADIFSKPTSIPRSLPFNSSTIFILRNKLINQKRMAKRIIHHVNRDSGHAKEYIALFEKELSK